MIEAYKQEGVSLAAIAKQIRLAERTLRGEIFRPQA